MSNYLEVEGNTFLKDKKTGAIVNNDTNQYHYAKRQREIVLSQIEYQRKVDVIEGRIEIIMEKILKIEKDLYNS